MARLFISYSRNDVEFARRVATFKLETNMSWIDPEEVARRRREIDEGKQHDTDEQKRTRLAFFDQFDAPIRRILVDFATQYIGEKIRVTETFFRKKHTIDPDNRFTLNVYESY